MSNTMWKFNLPLLVCLSLGAGPAKLAGSGDTEATRVNPPIRVRVWTWLIKIQNINYPADELTVDMFITFTYDLKFKDKINPMKHFEIVEAKSVTMLEVDETPRPAKSEYYQTFRCIAVIGKQWDTLVTVKRKGPDSCHN